MHQILLQLPGSLHGQLPPGMSVRHKGRAVHPNSTGHKLIYCGLTVGVDKLVVC